MRNQSVEKVSVEKIITDRIIEMLESGVIPWERPWVGTQDFAYNRITAKTAVAKGKRVKPYSILNQLLLDRPGEWASFKQWGDCHCRVKKGEKGRICVWWSKVSYPAKDKKTGEFIKDDEGKQVMASHWILKYYTVFHISQVERVEKDGTKIVKSIDDDGNIVEKEIDNWVVSATPIEPIFKPTPLPCGVSPIEQAETVFHSYLDRYQIGFDEGGDQAYYRPSTDSITLPIMDAFKSAEEYYSTAFHEATHSTGHESRLNRLTKDAAFGNGEYSKEELCAEIGAASCLHRLGIGTDSSMRNSAAYIQSWLKALRNNEKMLASACGKAEKAVALIFGDCDELSNEGGEEA